MALIEVVPSKGALHAVGYVPLVPGLGTAASLVDKRTVAFEARLRDAQSGKIVATFADREKQDAGPIDLTRVKWFGLAKGIIEEWSGQMVEIANRRPGEVVKDPIPVTLRPW